MKKQFLLLIFMLSCFTHLFAQEGRISLEKELKIAPRHYMQANLQWRFLYRDRVENDIYLKLNYEYNISKLITVGTSSRISSEIDFKIEEYRYRGTIDATLKSKKKQNQVRYSNRIRYAYIWHSDEETAHTFRNKFKVSIPYTKEVKPYLAAELLLDCPNCSVNSMRYFGGTKIDVGSFDLNIQYSLESKAAYKTINFNHILSLAVIL